MKKNLNHKKRILFLVTFILILIGISISLYFLLAKESSAWYNPSWMYRRPLLVANTSGSTLTNEDVLVILDTQTLISQSKLQADCGDLKFIDSDDSSSLDYWIEDDCNTTSTKVWTRIPSLPNGGKTIYVYYGNSGATNGFLTWSGNIYMYADTTCPSGWTAAPSGMNNRFLYGSSTTFGSTYDSSSHSHNTLSATSTSISTTNIAGSTSSGTTGTNTTHTHSNLAATVNSDSTLPQYRDMILCYDNEFLISSGLISLFDDTTPSGYTRFTALDNSMPRVNSSYGSSVQGATTHSHTANTGTTTAGPSASANTITEPLNATGGTITYASGYKIHKFTSSGTFVANVGGTVEALVVGGGGGGGWDSGGGGGAGGVVYNTSYSITSGSKNVTVGGGGSANNNGGNSVFIGLTAYGGGGGGPINTNGQNGGSGGGAGGHYGTSTTTYGGSGSQGNSGGNSIGSNITAGGGGGKGAAGTTSTSQTVPGNGGSGSAYSITGTSLYYAGGGGGGSVNNPAGTGGAGGGGNGSNVRSVAGSNGTANTGGGGGGGGSIASGGTGGSGIVIIRYTNPPALSGTGATGTHTHTISSAVVNSANHMPPYMTTILAKANSAIYVNENNIIPSSAVPPLGWNQYTDLNDKFVLSSSTPGTFSGNSTHSHTSTLTTGTPSATLSIYGTGANFAGGSHYHSASPSTNSVSNLPSYYTVIYIQRKVSQSVTLQSEEAYNLTPSAPSSLQTEGSTNPTAVGDLTPEFSAVFSDPDTGDTGIYYQIQVNTNNTFTGTVMWDSNKTPISPITNGARSSDISYDGTTLSNNGTTYYWRIKFWDNGDVESPWSSTAQFTMDMAPSAPTSLLTEALSNPPRVGDLTPEFSAIFNDGAGDTGVYYEIEVNTNNTFTGTVMWDSGQQSITPITNGARSSDISYNGTTLSYNGTTYYWRIRFWNQNDAVSSWSSTAQFTMDTPPNAPTSLLAETLTNPTNVSDLTPEFSAIFSDPNTGDTGIYYQIQVNTNSTFDGISMWAPSKTSITAITNNTRSSNISYNGTALSADGTLY
ncbi:MAG: DUF2341 domain-containing protein, partial [Candidatus Dojkabacteria bacterium]|nr:DUF2341 domain-containing protein [Candidatus Dojkabacteria bacterium]